MAQSLEKGCSGPDNAHQIFYFTPLILKRQRRGVIHKDIPHQNVCVLLNGSYGVLGIRELWVMCKISHILALSFQKPMGSEGVWVIRGMGYEGVNCNVRKTLKLKFLFFFIYFCPVEPKHDSKCSQSDHGNNNSHTCNYSIVYAPVHAHPCSMIKYCTIYVT